MLVGPVRSQKSSHKESLKKALLCKDYSDLTRQTINHVLGKDTSVSVVYDTL